MPASTAAEVTVAAPVTPMMVVGPVALRLTVLAATMPPWVLLMVLTSVKTGDTSASLMVQVDVWPTLNTKLLLVSVPAEQLQAPGV